MPSHATIVAPPPETLTLREKILLAALTIEAETFDTDTIVVRSWQRYPESFSLGEHPHPNSNAVIAKLSGDDGLVGLRWFERTGQRTYRVTQVGRNHAIGLDVRGRTARDRDRKAAQQRAPRPKKPAQPVTEGSFSERDILAVARLAKSPVLARFNRAVALTADDAREFWSRTSPDAVREILDRATDYVIHARRPDGRVPEVGTLGVLRNLNSTLALRFPTAE
jgi:hypothetical protein